MLDTKGTVIMALHGWLSKKQKAQCGSVLYLNTDGKKVEVTEVSNQQSPDGKWGDYTYVGLVTEFVCVVNKIRTKEERAAFSNVISVIHNAPAGSSLPQVFAKYFSKRLTVQQKQRAIKKRLKKVIPEMEAACMLNEQYQYDAMPGDFGYNHNAYHSWEHKKTE